MAPRAVRGRVHVRRLEARRVLVGRPLHVRDLIFRPQFSRGVFAMALETPLHRERLIDANDVHLIDASVTGRAPDADGEVHAVIEVGVIGQLVHANPLHGLTAFPARSNRREPCGIGLHDRVTAHARLGGWDHRVCRSLDVGVAIATIDAHFSGVKGVAVRHRLHRLVTDLEIFGREVIPDSQDEPDSCAHCPHTSNERQLVQGFGKDLHARAFIGRYAPLAQREKLSRSYGYPTWGFPLTAKPSGP